jgi:predicted Zn-dependent protease
MGWRSWKSLVAAVILVTGCVRNPVTGKRQLTLISEKQELAMGAQAAKDVEAQMGLVDDARLNAYVSNVGMRLAKDSQRPHLPWSFKVVDDPAPNAFALPGGYIYVTRGMLALMNSEAELAMVLGHEVGHVTAKHSVSQITKAQLAQAGLGLGMVLVPSLQGVGSLAGAGLQLLFLRFSRDAERQADDLGFGYSLRHGYDARDAANVFRALSLASEQSGQGRVPQWLATHPNPENRVETLEAKAAKTRVDWAKLKRNEDEFLAHIDGMVYGEDPRQGFFKGNAFMHPNLKFQAQFPQGWKTQNSPAAVAAVSPSQDAVVFLAAAGRTAPEQALRQFLSQPGIAVGDAARTSVQGLPAASAVFQAQTEQGVVQGLVTFLSYGGSTFQWVGYTTPQRFGAMAPAFESTMGSFSTLTDPAALAVQPARLDVQKLPRSMTMTQLSQDGAGAEPKTLALINGVSVTEALPRGREVKKIVPGNAAGVGGSAP